MFWVMMAGILPARYSEASARWPRPGFAAAKIASIAKRRRHDSSRASRLATNSSNGIGRLRVHNPPGERKSGIPHSVEMPAPVKGTMLEASAIMLPSCSTPLRKSLAITDDHPTVGCTNYSTVNRIAGSALLGRFGDRLLRLPHLVALLDLGDGRGFDFFHRLAVLGEPFQFRFELGAPRGDLFKQLVGGMIAQGCEFFDAQQIQIDLCHDSLPFPF